MFHQNSTGITSWPQVLLTKYCLIIFLDIYLSYYTMIHYIDRFKLQKNVKNKVVFMTPAILDHVPLNVCYTFFGFSPILCITNHLNIHTRFTKY